jgi:hypothetical protein
MCHSIREGRCGIAAARPQAGAGAAEGPAFRAECGVLQRPAAWDGTAKSREGASVGEMMKTAAPSMSAFVSCT